MNPTKDIDTYRIPSVITFEEVPKDVTVISVNGYEPIDFHKDLERED